MPYVMHWPARMHSGWRVWLPAAGLALSLHLGLLWALADHASTPRFRIAERISVTMMKLAAPTAKPAAAAIPAVHPVPTPSPARAKPAAATIPAAHPAPTPAPGHTPGKMSKPTPSPTKKKVDDASAPKSGATPHESPSPKLSVQGNRPDSEPDHSAAFLNNPAPHYPHAAQRRGLQGRVVLNVEVLATGRCGRIKVLQSSGHAMLDDAAVKAVKRWRFIPAARAGTPVDYWLHIPIRFRLRGVR